MCGLVFVLRRDMHHAHKMVWKRYKEQITRGTDGYGYVAIENGYLKNVGRAESEKEIEPMLSAETAEDILFHHRIPTSTPNFIEATHPIYVSHPELAFDYYVAHNGVIRNCDALKTIHEYLGYTYTTEMTQSYTSEWTKNSYNYGLFNDSESFAIELARTIEGKQTKIDAKGSIAFIAIAVEKDTKKVAALYYGRNTGNPLKETYGGDKFTLSSEGTGTMVVFDRLHKYDYITGESTYTELEIGEYNIPTGTGYYTKDYRDDWEKDYKSEKLRADDDFDEYDARAYALDEAEEIIEDLYTQRTEWQTGLAEAVAAGDTELETTCQAEIALIDELIRKKEQVIENMTIEMDIEDDEEQKTLFDGPKKLLHE